jgi:hypothetical protein
MGKPIIKFTPNSLRCAFLPPTPDLTVELWGPYRLWLQPIKLGKHAHGKAGALGAT